MKQSDVLILGAGLAGTLAAYRLKEKGFSGTIAAIDARTKFDREQRWCGWTKLPAYLAPVVGKTWRSWTVRDETTETRRSSAEYVYSEVYAPRFFEYFHAKLQNELSLGETVLEIAEKHDGVEVRTDKEIRRAKIIFDARNEGSANFRKLADESEFLLNQIFVGHEVEFARCVFDAENAVLMDFRTAQTDGLNFIYVLPYDEKRALVESTAFTRNAFDRSAHERAIDIYLDRFFGADYKIRATESGALPMTVAKFPPSQSARIFSIGTAGGAARPSSAYALNRILRETEKIVGALCAKKPIADFTSYAKYDLFDAVLLESLVRNPATTQQYFMKMFAEVAPESLIRFMLDESRLAEDFTLMNASPRKRFAVFAAQSLRRRFFGGTF